MPPEHADLLRRSALLLLEHNAVPSTIEEKRELPAPKIEAAVKLECTPVQEKGVTVLDELLGVMLTEVNAVDRIVSAVALRQRQMRESGWTVVHVNVELKFSRPAGQKVGITMCEHFDIEEVKKDLAAVHRLGFNCVAGYAC